jgi:hypothetical protein
MINYVLFCGGWKATLLPTLLMPKTSDLSKNLQKKNLHSQHLSVKVLTTWEHYRVNTLILKAS